MTTTKEMINALRASCISTEANMAAILAAKQTPAQLDELKGIAEKTKEVACDFLDEICERQETPA